MQLRPPTQGGSAATPTYDYGYPAGTGGGVQPDVVAQWIFNEASGDILDQVGSVDLTESSGVGGGLSYRVPIGYTDPNGEDMSPGLFVMSRATGGSQLVSTATSLGIGTGSATFEWVAQYTNKNNLNSTGTIFYTCNNSITQGIYLYYDNCQSATCRFEIYMKATDGTLFYLAGNIAVNPFTDMQKHKHRVVLNRAGNAEYFIDGVLQLSGSMAAVAGKDFPCSQVILMGATTSGINQLCAWITEFRMSLNATNNSGGPGGG